MAQHKHLRQFLRKIAEIAALNLKYAVLPCPVRVEITYLRFVIGFVTIIAFQRIVYRLFVQRPDRCAFTFKCLCHGFTETLRVRSVCKRRLVCKHRIDLLLYEFRHSVVLVGAYHSCRSFFQFRYRVLDRITPVSRLKHRKIVPVVSEAYHFIGTRKFL